MGTASQAVQVKIVPTAILERPYPQLGYLPNRVEDRPW
jgi:hypothetical protein